LRCPVDSITLDQNTLKKSITFFSILMLLCTISSQGQCFSRKGIMNATCASLTIVKPPAFDVSIGLSNTDIYKVDVNYITQNEIVYGGAIGVRLFKTKSEMLDITSINGFLGYNLLGCIIVGCTAGFSHTANIDIFEDKNHPNKWNYQSCFGMSVKFISTITDVPITVGGFASNAGIGITVGTIF
jgi:hypothetical protein